MTSRNSTGPDSLTIDVDGVGPVVLERSRRARRIIISVRPVKGVRVAVPLFSSFKEAEKFLFSKIDWIKQRLEDAKLKTNPLCDFSDINLAEAKRILTARIEYLAAKNGFSFNRITVRRQRTRWGSCSQKNCISLNARLISIPEELMDYVILHELVHTKIHNHSKRFWKELDKYVGDSRSLSKKMRSGLITF
jgi:predicted metal-dependent hydrolase